MEKVFEEIKIKPPHSWCNRHHSEDIECKMCRVLHEKYPMDGITNYTDMLMKYFPNVLERK